MVHYDLIVCIRCHKHFDFVVDTAESVRANTGQGTLVTFAVDGGARKLADQLRGVYGPEHVYEAARNWGWGAGLFCLLVESISYFGGIHSFSHFQSIDYDTLYLAPGADRMILDSITSDRVGLLGCYCPRNSKWRKTFGEEREGFTKTFGPVPATYVQGEGVQGGYMTLTRSLLDRMIQRGMLGRPFAEAKRYTSIADDHLLPIFVRMCGLEIVDVRDKAECYWQARRDPRGLEKEGVYVYHPTKVSPRNQSRSTDIELRNYFRNIRGSAPLR